MNLTRGSSYLHLPDWLANEGEIINPKNQINEECFKWSVITGLHYEENRYHAKRISNLLRFEDNYDCDGLEFPLSIKGISESERKTTSSLMC